jgi:hypothetical protein
LARAEKPLAKQAPPRTERDERLERHYREWIGNLAVAFQRLASATPAPLRDAVVARLNAVVERAKAGGLADELSRDGLARWCEWTTHRDEVLIPERVPAELVRAYLDDPKAMPFHSCGECGLLVPTDEHRHIEYFPVCPVCGGETGVLAWHHGTYAAAEAAGLGLYSEENMGKGVLAVLREAGYRPGERLSDWLTRYNAKGEKV